MERSKKLMLIGGLILLIGWCLIVATVIEVINPPLWQAFVFYAMTLIGFGLGITGASSYIKLQKQEKLE